VGQVVAGTAQQDLAGTRTNHKVHQHRFTRHGIQSLVLLIIGISKTIYHLHIEPIEQEKKMGRKKKEHRRISRKLKPR